MKIKKIFISIFLISSIFCKSFFISNDNGLNKQLSLKPDNLIDIKDALLSEESSLEYAVFYQINNGYDIEVNLSFDEQIVDDQFNFDINKLEHEWSEDGIYPKSNFIVSEPIFFRDVVIRKISFIPFIYDSNTQELKNLYNVTVEVNELASSQFSNFNNIKRSRLFEPFYEDMIVNYERSSREEDYQASSILYICGGNSLNHPYVQDLIEWRHKIGYVVNAVSTNDIGSDNASTIKNYIQNAYETWDNPPEIVGLIGDTDGSYEIGYFTENWSGYNGAGDLPYSQLDGDDLLPEVFIGRISVNSSNDLSNVINKTLAYEKASYINQTGTGWYEKAALCGDPSSSGNSTIITNEYIENILDVYGFENISTNYGSGNYDSWLENKLEDGSLYMNYRGYYGSSGFGGGEINGANNGYMTPFASFITCGTGDFNWTSLSEEFFRAGTVTNPKGAVASVGTATTGTHTLFNNIMSMGIFDGIFPKELHTAGAAVANGRLSLYHTYPSNPSNKVSIFSHWLNLIGDPALHLWTDTPIAISADFEENITFGTNYIDVYVGDNHDEPVSNAKVTLLKGNDEIFMSSYTNNLGVATFHLDYSSTGEVYVTVTKQNCIPIEDSFNITDPANNVNLSYDNISVNDIDDGVANGNNDGLINPGEIVYLDLPLYNYGTTSNDNVQAILTSESDFVNIIYGISQYNNINPNQLGYQNSDFIIEIEQTALEGHDLELRLNITDSDGYSWSSIVPIQVYGGFLSVSSIQSIDNFEINPGEEIELSITLNNQGSIMLENVNLELLPSGALLNILQSNTFFGNIASGQTAQSSNNNQVRFFVNGNTINGSSLGLNARITANNGYSQDIVIAIQIGHATVFDPLGPDEYGYYIYDSNDLDYSLAPIYDWMEIDPDYGGDGINLNLSDGGDGNNISNSSAIVNLPFDFTFYGVVYDKITVNTNGWISFGESSLESFRNYPIPGAGGPSPMLAVFWDDLKTSSSADVYKYIGDNFVVIEWSEMRTYNNNSQETFQIILYDDSELTPTGDNEILIQYKEFNNTSSGNLDGWGITHGGYCTVGIENHLSTIGLQYTFNNQYPTPAMPLSDNTALFITTRNPVEALLGDSNQDGEVNVIDVVVVVNHIINLELLSAMGIYMSDMDGNGLVNILDVIQIINFILES
ncbi:MAG: hypothetical protein CMG64_02200 [Candidatus Marinimicrobia bacterium]|nr:hypothetical protein [Candidatus Neomarinimicrobiota bacterium]